MNKSLLNTLGIAILVIIVISIILSLTGAIPGKIGDLIIMGSGIVIAIVVVIFLRKNKQ